MRCLEMNASIEIFDEAPTGFSPHVEVAAIYVNVNGKILLLRLADHKNEKGKWGVPAGKLDKHETALQAAKRELFEETGIDSELEAFQSLGALYIRKPELDYVYHLFGINQAVIPSLLLSAEHCSHLWVSREEARDLPLMNGAMHSLDTYYQKISKKRSGASVNVYLILPKQNEILLSLRKNTGYCDGYYGLVAGHVEDNESAIAAIIREAYEEVGIHIKPSSLKVVHVMHRQTNRFNIDIFFKCHEWQGDITNLESNKCESLNFFPIKQLPSNTIDYISDALNAIANQNFYSEHGW